MIFNKDKHKVSLYNNLLILSRNIFFYKKINLTDSFETRIYLMFFHFSIMMIVFKRKGSKFDQESYDSLFHNIEYNLREMGFGDVSVNKKMKDLNKILYDILLKMDINMKGQFKINDDLFFKYFKEVGVENNEKHTNLSRYFVNFYDFCFELSLNSMVKNAINFKYNYGSSKT